MNITLLGQGFVATSQHSVGNHLIKFFADKDFHTFTGISAFASQAGIRGLSKHFKTAKKHLKIITIVTGVDQKGTSKEALEELLGLDINVFVFYQPSITIFHPKIYLFEGEEKSELIIGSSNLTSQGLFTNVEASLLVSIDNSTEADRKIVEQLKNYFKGIFDFSDPNLKKLNKKIIADLVKAKVVPTEAERKAAQDKAEKAERTETENIISKIFPKRAIAKIPSEFRGARKPTTKTIAATATVVGSVTAKGDLAWQKINIPRSIAQQVPNGTAIRGVIGLGDAGFKVGGKKVDRNSYFRNDVFGKLKWTLKQRKNNSPLEEAVCEFHIKILGNDLGKHDLRISHDPERASNQNNILTDIHWGRTLNAYLRENSIVGKSLFLYKPTKDSSTFSIVVE
ncbi:MAG: NgoFVII family restriction endonuclease [Sphingobacteriales bacterium]|nr:NgoFVII family restriction endonuclease [Sphingobacteriales bacterium]MBI3717198.1 NgoFVII family restriction endonuclease [Sphingobacteriales bacterium]